MGLPAPAQGTNGKRVHVDPKGDTGAFAVSDANQRIPSTDLEPTSPAHLQGWPHSSSIRAFRTCTSRTGPLARDCGSICCPSAVQPLPMRMSSSLPHAGIFPSQLCL